MLVMSPDDPCVTRTRRRGRARHRRSKEITEDVLSRLSREGGKRVSHLPASVKRGANVRFFLWVSCLLIRVQEDVFERRGMAPSVWRLLLPPGLTWEPDFLAFLTHPHVNCVSFWNYIVSCISDHEGNVNDKMQTKRKTSDKRTLLYAWVS